MSNTKNTAKKYIGISPELHAVLKEYLNERPYKEVKNMQILLDNAPVLEVGNNLPKVDSEIKEDKS